MSFESKVNASVHRMFSHTKVVVNRNLTAAVKEGKITIDPNKLPGLNLLISQSIDEALRGGSKDLNSVLAENALERERVVKEAKSKGPGRPRKT